MTYLKSIKTSEIKDIMQKSSYNSFERELFEKVYQQDTLIRLKQTIKNIPVAFPKAHLVDIGCYAPMISLYSQLLGYQSISALAMYDWDALSTKMNQTPTDIQLNVFIQDVEKTKLPFDDQSVDVVLLLEVLEHFSIDPVFVMAEINRILKPEGVLVLSVPNILHPLFGFNHFLGKNPCKEPYNGYDANRHNRLYTSSEIKQLATDTGFECEVLTTIRTSTNFPTQLLLLFYHVADGLNLLRGKNLFYQRGEIILSRMIKKTAVKERYPRWLYINRDIYRNWYESFNLSSSHVDVNF